MGCPGRRAVDQESSLGSETPGKCTGPLLVMMIIFGDDWSDDAGGYLGKPLERPRWDSLTALATV